MKFQMNLLTEFALLTMVFMQVTPKKHHSHLHICQIYHVTGTKRYQILQAKRMFPLIIYYFAGRSDGRLVGH